MHNHFFNVIIGAPNKNNTYKKNTDSPNPGSPDNFC